MPDNTTEQPSTAPPKYERTDNFISIYANSAFFEASAWDLKIIFGQLDQGSQPIAVKQNLAVTIPWAQAKLALFWLRFQVEVMEEQTGKIPLRQDVIPIEPPPLTPDQEKDPSAKRIYEAYVRARTEFMATL
jgi:hypothetical protein